MRYSKEHKQETHARIVKKASVRLREKGAHGIGVADLMKEAGLTHGGFYAHFDSREVPRKAARKQAVAALATMMGTLVLSRIAGNGEFSDEILSAGREAVLGRAAKPAAKKAKLN